MTALPLPPLTRAVTQRTEESTTRQTLARIRRDARRTPPAVGGQTTRPHEAPGLFWAGSQGTRPL